MLFFAAHREIVGTGETTVEVPAHSTVADLIDSLRARGEPWTDLPAELAVAVNLAYSPDTTVLRDGDEVALIPPVAGG